ncbi:hypothetical protein EST92_19750 [Streptomyces sp. TM32]|uniref:hypothetical protein n=1 Tax=Streptomyces sp. TM32 TaxID=1652669 RepID=UPI0010136B5B|nr:hypothetical protein [Streptomyces sp. TM32]RXS78869.1 hypothetical protein EST92_19750 [Streptomyces sp. TM32]
MATATPTPPARDIAALDEQARKLLAIELDRLQQRIPLTDGRLAEQRHLLDADLDTCLPLPGVEHKAPDAAGSTLNQFLADLSGGDLPATAVREGRCLRSPIGCGQPLIEDGAARVFWDEAEAARYEAEWRITGLCPNCQDRIDADEENDRG